MDFHLLLFIMEFLLCYYFCTAVAYLLLLFQLLTLLLGAKSFMMEGIVFIQEHGLDKHYGADIFLVSPPHKKNNTNTASI